MFNLNEAMENIKKGRAAAKAMEDKNEVEIFIILVVNTIQ